MSPYSVGKIPHHIHNNIDSPYAFTPIMTYIGAIIYDGSIALAPNGWTVDFDGINDYTITHNLGSDLYAVNVTSAQGNNEVVTAVVGPPFPNSFDVSWFKTVDASKIASSFYFTLTAVKNTHQYPNYSQT